MSSRRSSGWQGSNVVSRDRKQAKMGQFRERLPDQLGEVTDWCLSRYEEIGRRRTMDEPGFWLDRLCDSAVIWETRSSGRGAALYLRGLWGLHISRYLKAAQSLNPKLQRGTKPGKQIRALSASNSGAQRWLQTGITWWILNISLHLSPISNN